MRAEIERGGELKHRIAETLRAHLEIDVPRIRDALQNCVSEREEMENAILEQSSKEFASM